jgi:hypothetical protein
LALVARQISYRQYLFLLISCAFICLSIIPDFPLGKRFNVAHGNSVWSFAYLFLVAGFIKHHINNIPKIYLLLTIVLITLLTIGCEVYLGYNKDIVYLSWLNYNGLPFILSIAVFIIVRQFQVPQNRFWNVMMRCAPYTFGVYLIHDHLLVREWLWTTIPMQSFCSYLIFPLIVIGVCAAIFIVGVMIDIIRKKVFVRLRVDKLLMRVDKFSFYS